MTHRIGSIAAFLLVVAGLLAATAAARTTAVPRNTAAPTLSGQAREGSSLTVSNGTWENSPTSYTYLWQRCAANGGSCTNIPGATKQTYTLTAADVDHTVRALVTATNADGSASATSNTSQLVASTNAPTNTAKPVVTGTPAVGNELSATTGTWTGGVRTYRFQWQRCQLADLTCVNVSGATSRTYGIRTADIGQRIRVAVTASNPSSSATAYSDPTGIVTAVPGSTTTSTTVVTTTVAGNRAPTISFLSLRRSGVRVFARFRVCDDKPGRIVVTERDNKARALSATRRYAVNVASCGTFARSWVPASRFRTRGRYVVTLRAQDRSGALSRIVSRSLTR
jgi:hypothetical protein